MITGSSHYYYTQMQQFHKEILANKKEKETYDKVLPLVQSLASGLPSIKENLTGAKSDCESGGFNSGGEPYGQGRFEDCISKIDSASSSLDTAIATITAKITALEAAIDHFQTKYNTAKTNYGIALNRERELAKK